MAKLYEILKEDWNKIATDADEALCILPFSVQELENIIHHQFFEYIEDGLGLLYGIFLNIDDAYIFCKGLSLKDFEIENRQNRGVTVYIRSYEPNPKKVLSIICNFFHLKENELLWITDKDFTIRWEVYKVDNGNETRVNQFLSEHSARSTCKRYEKNMKGNEQKCFIRRVVYSDV